MSDKDDVRRSSQKFYAALTKMAKGDSSSMADAWWHTAAVTAMHPVGGRQVGWEEVGGSFAEVAKLASAGMVDLTDQIIHVSGDMAYEVGIEKGAITLGGHEAAIDQRVTNIYQRQDGAWRLVHHHADISPAMLDVLGKLQAPGA